jgi:HlyD family secretion protein
VKSRASGELRAIQAEIGHDVERGQVLAEIDPRDVRSTVAETGADLEVAKARHNAARTQLARMEQLRAAEIVTEQEYESAVLEEANASAQVLKAQTKADLAREQMGDVTIRAPITGTIILREVETGQIVTSASQNVSGGTTLFEMADLSRMQVRTLVDETDIGRVRAGQTVAVTVDAFPDQPMAGTVLKVEPRAVVEENVTLFPVVIRLENADRLLKPGMTADVEILVSRLDRVVAVPNDAVLSVREGVAGATARGLDSTAVRNTFQRVRTLQPGPSGQAASPGQSSWAGRAAANDRTGVVFVAGPNGPEPRLVGIGQSTWDFTEIRAGLAPGEVVLLVSGVGPDSGTGGGLGRLFGGPGRSGARAAGRGGAP